MYFVNYYPIANGLIAYLDAAAEFLIVTFSADMIAFFDLIYNILIIKSVCFILVFAGIYLWIFITFFSTLKEEIWLTHEILKLVPMTILEKNVKVRDEVLKRKSYQ